MDTIPSFGKLCNHKTLYVEVQLDGISSLSFKHMVIITDAPTRAILHGKKNFVGVALSKSNQPPNRSLEGQHAVKQRDSSSGRPGRGVNVNNDLLEVDIIQNVSPNKNCVRNTL